MRSPADTLQSIVRRIESLSAVDGVAEKASEAVGAATAPTVVRNALSGSWLGHQLHPIMVQVPIGAWGAATFLDLVGGDEAEDAARKLVGAGILGALPAAASGASDWSYEHGAASRVGLVHGLANETAAGLQIASWIVRGSGRRGVGAALSLAAIGLTGAAGYLGGHLSFVQGVGVNKAAGEEPAEDWIDVASCDALSQDELQKVTADGRDLVLIRQGETLHAVSDVCTHAGAPLHEGSVEDGCLVCPWHGSRFRVEDGGVERGPATVPQPAWEVRVEGGRVQVRAARR
ncbi:Rieske 2Fe-2S domain-containing protein [Kocuria palustris]|uniref:Rieske 2Fe-2S domain-containing protein n=1 Tax=Kocuria palustris TaxID=71999 RepID=UPI0011A3D1E1|nr:Rieske 2Fe-2S domain-containing protein [Kocuria palustris]